MIVFSCEFPAPPLASIETITDILKTWIIKSPHYPFSPSDDLDFPSENQQIKEINKSDHHLSLAHVVTDNTRSLAIRHFWTETSEKEWTTEVVVTKLDPGTAWVSVKLFCDLLRPGLELPKPKKPYVVRLLAENQSSAGSDGPLQVTGKPIVLDEKADITLASAVLSGTAGNHMPIVYISNPSPGARQLNAAFLAQMLSGLAHVILEPSRDFSLTLAKSCNRTNCYGGAIGIYWPNGDGEHLRILPWEIRTHPQTEYYIFRKVKEALLTAGTSKGSTWIEIKDILAHKHLEAIRQKGNSSLKEYINAFDATNRALEEKIKALKEQNESLKATLHGYQIKNQTTYLSFKKGAESEFYSNEKCDLIICALRKYKANIKEGSRAWILVNDLLTANTETGNQVELLETIKDAFRDGGKLGTREIAALKTVGFDISEEGKHYKAVFYGDPRFTFSLPKTPSDHRSGKNTEHDITNQILFR